MLVTIAAILGIGVIAAGILSMRFTRRLLTRNEASNSGKTVRLVGLVLGFVLAAAFFHPASHIVYPPSADETRGTAIGAPFMTGFIDARGRAYVGPLTIPSLFGNALFWFMIPQPAVAVWYWLRSRPASSNHVS